MPVVLMGEVKFQVDILCHNRFHSYLTLPVWNCSGERSVSHVKCIKNATRSNTTGQEKLSSLTLVNIESEIIEILDFKDILVSFTSIKSRSQDIW